MQKSKMEVIRDYIVKHSKFVFPVIVIVVVAFTVSIALNAGNAKEDEQEESLPSETASVPESQAADPEPASKEVPLVANEDSDLYTLIATYYNAMATGESDVLASLYDEVSDNDVLRYSEMAKYLDHIPALEVYTKPGYAEGDTLVYVYYRLCFKNHEEEVPGWQTFYVSRDDTGKLYMKNGKNLTPEENEYVVAVSAQDDVVEFNNRVSVEFNDLLSQNPDIGAYMSEFGSQVQAAIGVTLAEQNVPEQTPQEGSEGENPEAGGEGENPEAGGEGGESPEAPAEPEPPVQSGPQYATATTTVNVRSSDSEQADKLGKVPGGTKVQVQEVRVNGWTKIVFEGSDGYIKSEFLQMEESAEGQTAIGTVTATTNINVRAAASEDAERLGLLSGGDSLELLANENDWCKVNYNGKIGYVKAEYVTQ